MTAPEHAALDAILAAAERNALDDMAKEAAGGVKDAADRCAAILADVGVRYPNAGFASLPPQVLAELQRCIKQYAMILRATGSTPEAALVSIKRLINGSTISVGAQSRAMMESAVRWGIEGYYHQ